MKKNSTYVREEQEWFLTKEKVKTDYVVIEDVKKFDADLPPLVHPSVPEYIDYWSWETKYCIEGYWSTQFNAQRFCPPKLRFFRNWGVLEHTINKQTVYIKPLIMDYIWDYAYMSLICYGFSGFSKDKKYSSDIRLKLFADGKFSKSELKHLGLDKRTYVDPWEYLQSSHSRNLGKPLYDNPTQNKLVMGSRGGSKSYWEGLAEFEHNFVFDGAKSYGKDFLGRRLACKQNIGSAEAKYSEDLMKKLIFSQDAKANPKEFDFRERFGIYGEPGDDDFTPCPFFRRATGSEKVGTKYSARYKEKINGKWTWVESGTSINHVSYSPNKTNSHTAGAGTRVLYSDVEETGLVPNFIAIQGSNEGTISRGGERFGVQAGQGTSGNLQSVQDSKQVFLDPRSYNTFAVKNQWDEQGEGGEIAYFLPYYITKISYKDENGNTEWDRCLASVNNDIEEKALSKDPQVLIDFLMNKPNRPYHMWLTQSFYYFPFSELDTRMRQLMKNNTYREIANPVKLIADPNEKSGIRYELDPNAQPLLRWPIPKDQNKWQGSVVIYDFPPDKIPPDMYFYLHDPYVEEDLEKGGSIGTTYVIMNPKYNPKHAIVASYLAKPKEGLDYYYETQEKLIQFYGNCPQAHYYEKVRGAKCREHYIKKNKIHLLAPTPQISQGDSMYEKQTNSFGFNVGNRVSKLNLIKNLADHLKEMITVGDQTMMRLYTINCPILIAQLMSYNLTDNFDAVSAYLGAPIAVSEFEFFFKETVIKKSSTFVSQLLEDPRIFSKKRYNYD